MTSPHRGTHPTKWDLIRYLFGMNKIPNLCLI